MIAPGKHALRAVVSALVLSLAGCSGGGGDEQVGGGRVVRLAFPSEGAAFWPDYVAIDKGYYKAEGLEVQTSEIDPNVTVSSLIAGAMDVVHADSSQLLFAREKGADLVAVGLSTDRQPYWLMAAPGVKSVAQLKGRKIGATSEVDVYTDVIRELVRKAGLDSKRDVIWAFGGNQPRRVAALSAGGIDAGLFSPPSSSRLKAMGYNQLVFIPDTIEHLALNTQAVRRDWAQAHGDALRRMLKAQKRAVDWLYDPAHRIEALKILSHHTHAAPADASVAYTYFVEARTWRDGCIHPDGLGTVVRMMRGAGQLHATDVKDVPRFVDRAWCPQG